MPKYKGVLFDLDGTLIRSMDGHFAAWREAFQKLFSVTILPDDFFPLEGNGLSKIAQMICDKYNISPCPAEEIIQTKEAAFLAGAGQSVEAYSGALELARALKAHAVPFAIVTVGHYERVKKTTPPELLAMASAVITGDRVQRPKPFPDPYIEGARALGFDAKECIAFENAPGGVQSAKGSGAYTVGIAQTVSRELLVEADAVIDAIAEAITLPQIQQLLQS